MISVYLVVALVSVLGLSLYVNWRQARTNGALRSENVNLRATIKQKDAQLVVFANTKPGGGAADLAAGNF